MSGFLLWACITWAAFGYFCVLGFGNVVLSVRVYIHTYQQFPIDVGNRLVAKTTQLESEKAQKETEVQKLMEENVRLSSLLDKKEAQLLAMNEQCKVMALNASNI